VRAVLRCAYIDLDGTLLGRGASLFHDGEGRPSMAGVRAIEACLRADVEIVLVSGRRSQQLHEDARLLGQPAYIFEAGAWMDVDGDLYWNTGDLVPVDGRTIHDQITESGAPQLLLDHFAGRLEYHDPWHLNRDVSHLFRGHVDAFEADALLKRHGHDDLRLVDNGGVHRRSEALAGLDQVRAYHLIPALASKTVAVARHRRMRGYHRDETIGVGDSREDLLLHDAVGSFWLVANALTNDPTIASAIGQAANVRVAESGHGAGVYEAIMETLALNR
jgi:hydroxymethylpyrimidine pyrophosphatase-like HAD family hydrolase